MRRTMAAAAVAAAVTVLAAGCGSSASSSSSGSGSSGTSSSPAAAAPVTLRLGFLENITHASALIAIKQGYFTKELGPNVTLKLTPFSTGTEEATALLAGQLDAAYVGPNPAIKAWQTSGGQLIRGISGSPSLGNTQDVSLRYWLKQHGLTTTSTGGGDVPITPITPNSDAVLAFQSGSIAST